MQTYLREVQNGATQSVRFVNSLLRSGEDAWVKWATTGKLEIRDVFATLAQETARAPLPISQ